MTPAGPQDLILHHYETSPFSEKVRVFLGMKGAAWRSVIVPVIMPKPDLMPLTGGYRRTPVLQIGADIYCDTQAMMAQIDARLPQAAPVVGPAWAVNLWADRPFFQSTVPVIFGELGEAVPQAFIRDREALSGRAFDVRAMKAVAEPMIAQWRAHAGFIERALADRPFLTGPFPGLQDAAAYMNIWFLSRSAPDIAATLLKGLERTSAWRDRIAAIGHGERSELEASTALEIAKADEPVGDAVHDSNDPLKAEPGDPISVMADDYGRDRIDGLLVAANPNEVVLEREDPSVGRVHVHFPRLGYVVTPKGAG